MAECILNPASQDVADFIYRFGSLQNNLRDPEQFPCVDYVSNDYAVFYDEIKEIEIESKTPTEIDTKLKFQSKEFNTNFDSIFELECKLRNPEKLYENVRDIMALYFDEELMNDGFDIPSQLGEFDNRKNVIYNIVQILSDEVPILNIVRAKKGKSGLMVTNYFFRVYSKGLFSTQDDLYDIEMVKDFKFLSKNQYQLHIMTE